MAIVVGLLTASVFATLPNSPRGEVTIENWDKGGALSHWVYTHVSEVFPSAVIRRGGPIVDLPVQIRPEIGALKVNGPNESQQTLDQFINNGAVDACIVLHDGKIVYEKYPTIQPDDLHIVMSVGKAVVLTALAILEDRGKIDIEKPVENYLPELRQRLGGDQIALPRRYAFRHGRRRGQ
jgi:CubicO group peptidase (beta-lactamase class C family)